MPEKTREMKVADRFMEAWDTHDVNTVMDCITDDCLHHRTNDTIIQGKEAIRALCEREWGLMPDMHFKIEGHYFFTPDNAMLEWVMSATHKELGPVGWRGCEVFTFREGLISGWSAFAKRGDLD